MERNVYRKPEERVLLRTADVYQTEAPDDVTSYSDRLLAIVADFENSGAPERFNAQSMVGKSKRGEVACRLFGSIDPSTGIIEAVGFKARGCLAMTGCASAACQLVEGTGIEEALGVSLEDIRAFVDDVPAGKVNALHFATCAIRALVGDFLIRDGASLAELDEAVPCDPDSISCLMAEHCSLRQSRLELRMAEDARARSVAEGNACAEALDLVRRRTLSGQLTTPADWADLVPSHMMPAEFDELVLGSLEAGSGADAPTLADHGTSPMAAAATAPAPKPSPFASRSVGVPTFFGNGAARQGAPADQPDGESTLPAQAAPSASATTDASEAPGAPASEASPEGVAEGASALAGTPTVFSYGKDARAAAQQSEDFDLIPPEGYKLVEVDGEWGLVETNEEPAPEERSADASGIRIMQGTESAYLYDSATMTPNYARWAFLACEHDPLFTFAYLVREESRTYPRPMAETDFANEPIGMEAAEVRAAWEQAQAAPAYADLARTEASNGDVYYYSTDYLDASHAASIAEWQSVGRFYNV